MNLSKEIDGTWQVQASKSNSVHEFSESEESNVFVYESVYVWYELL